MSIFKFKRFSVENHRSAMKVNTDGVLLGAAMTVKASDRLLLDVGTGTGTIALMAAQRLSEALGSALVSPVIDAIDIDEASAQEAAINFSNSPWPESLHAHHNSLEEFQASVNGKYDLIFSNPPYFEDSLPAPQERRSAARHTTGLSYRDLLDFAAMHLTDEGRFSIILPAEQEQALTRYARMNSLYLFRILRIKTVARKAPSRIIAEFSRARCDRPEDSELIIQEKGKYTEEYISLTHQFYLFA